MWFQNYDRMFSNAIVHTAIRNTIVWILVAPIAVTALGLAFAVLTERIVWSSYFKIILFMPLAISLFAVGVIWRIVYQQDPDRGVLNAGGKVVHDTFKSTGVLPRAQPSSDALTPQFRLKQPLAAGDTALLGLTGISPRDVPSGAEQAVKPQASQGQITGVVWRDFSPGGGKPGVIENGELGIPGVTVALQQNGKQVDTAKTANDGSFAFKDVSGSGYQAQVAPATFAQPYSGVNWLSSRYVTPAIIAAFLWTYIGFAMVIVVAGLSAIPRDVLEAARTDGATELQVFRRVTVPLLMPVLTVVFVTEVIAVLKVFDLIYAIAPGPVTDDATNLAYEMWRRSFQGQNRFGYGAAIASFLMLLFIPIVIYQVRSQRRQN